MPEKITPEVAVAMRGVLDEMEILSTDFDTDAIMREGREHPLPEGDARRLYSKVLAKVRGTTPDDPGVAATVEDILTAHRAEGIVRPETEA